MNDERKTIENREKWSLYRGDGEDFTGVGGTKVTNQR